MGGHVTGVHQELWVAMLLVGGHVTGVVSGYVLNVSKATYSSLASSSPSYR
ncbi:protein of unknown function [Shewanella benthica]|uniref:Uncharacterized protein n=1 Tax=Shewanella benthica TaxID=43661 RepID=A0A330M1E7_9GAMM|nr:protein of unknown function [Shewanella benthica]